MQVLFLQDLVMPIQLVSCLFAWSLVICVERFFPSSATGRQGGYRTVEPHFVVGTGEAIRLVMVVALESNPGMSGHGVTWMR